MRFEYDDQARMISVIPEKPWDHGEIKKMRLPFPYNRWSQALVVPEYAAGSLRHLPGFPPDLERRLYGKPEFNLLDVLSVPWAGKLYPFQREAVCRAVRGGGFGYFFDCGLGKTPTMLTAFHILHKIMGAVKGMIVLGPNVAGQIWAGEGSLTREWLGYDGYEIKTGDKRYPPTSGIVFCSQSKVFRQPYQTWIEERLRSGQWILCIDEAQLMSGHLSRRGQVVELWSRFAPWRWLASGTPVANYPDSFYWLYRIMTRANVEDREAFMKYFKKSVNTSGDYHEARLADFGKILKKDCMRVTKAEAAPWLPARTNQVLTVPLQGRQAGLYDEFVREGRVLLQNAERDWAVHGRSIFAKMARMMSLASHPGILGDAVRDEDLAKLETVSELLQTVGTQKVCVWSWHPFVCDWLLGRLPGEAVRYHGEVPEAERRLAAHRFNTDPNVKFFVGNPTAAGTALSLGAGSIAIFWDISWRWIDYYQAGERIDRITRTLPITQYLLLGAGTIEEYIWEKVQRKIDLQSLLFGKGGQDFLQTHWTPAEVWRIFNLWAGGRSQAA